jgi:hypothetical protein
MTIHDDLTAHTIYHDNPSQHAPTSSFCSPTTPPSHKYGGALFRPSDQPNRLCLFLLLDERGQRREPPWPPNREVQAHDTHRTGTTTTNTAKRPRPSNSPGNAVRPVNGESEGNHVRTQQSAPYIYTDPRSGKPHQGRNSNPSARRSRVTQLVFRRPVLFVFGRLLLADSYGR